jgi:hypothetical protein
MNPDKSVTAKASLGGSGKDDEALSFPAWGEVLASREEMKPDERSRWKFAIIGLLKFCKGERRPVSITLIKEYIEVMRAQGKLVAEPREAFLWFVAEARRESHAGGTSGSLETRAKAGLAKDKEARPAVGPTFRDPTLRESDRSMPSEGAEGLDGPDWEQALVRAARLKGLAWRTEVTYREWAARLVKFIEPRSPRMADKSDVKAFLEFLAVELRVASSTQKQALNAVVFFMQEGLGVYLGDFGFQAGFGGAQDADGVDAGGGATGV